MAVKEISGEEAAALGVLPPTDRPSALAVSLSPNAVLIDIPAELELDEPLIVSLAGESLDDIVWGHVVVRVGASAKATVVFEHTGSARYAAATSVLVGDNAHLDLVSVQLWDGRRRPSRARRAFGWDATHGFGASRPAWAETWCG